MYHIRIRCVGMLSYVRSRYGESAIKVRKKSGERRLKPIKHSDSSYVDAHLKTAFDAMMKRAK